MKKLILIICFFLISGLTIFCQNPSSILFKRTAEPKENAFSLLVPDGWKLNGGIFRVNPVGSGAANAIEAKLDFNIFKDQDHTVEIHWLPDSYYYDMSGSPAAAMFPEGSNYNGMLVLRKRMASQFVINDMIPFVHPKASDLLIINKNDARALEQIYVELDKIPQMEMKYDAFICDYTYRENGIKFKERMVCVLVDMGPLTAGMWKNTNTVFFRTPEAEFANWEPVFSIIARSVLLNSTWVRSEIEGQIKRGQIMVNTMQEVNRLDKEMIEAQSRTNAEINRQAFLNLTDQEDYINPHTGKVETGSNQWKNRWEDDLGNVLYTDLQDYNPNFDIELNMDGFKKCSIKK